MEQQIIEDIGKTVRFLVALNEQTVNVLWVSKRMADLADYLHSIDAEPEEMFFYGHTLETRRLEKEQNESYTY